MTMVWWEGERVGDDDSDGGGVGDGPIGLQGGGCIYLFIYNTYLVINYIRSLNTFVGFQFRSMFHYWFDRV